MQPKLFLEYALIAHVVLCAATLAVFWRRRLFQTFSFMAALMVVYALASGMSLATLFFRKQLGMSIPTAYHWYISSYGVSSVLEHALILCVLYQIFVRSMAPFRGLRRLGTLLFRWVCAVSMAVTIGIVMVPQQTGANRIMSVAGQFEQGISILTICLLLFVTLSSRHLGMTYRSHIFGASLGLGIFALSNLIVTAWDATHGVQPLYSVASLIPVVGGIVTLGVWGTYFLLPEPTRQLVLLPTTSPYFHWNQISEALGDNPGVVAVAGFTPDMLAPAERTMLGMMSQRLRGGAVKVDIAAPENAAMAMPR
jgi:hypothetical protein